MSFPNPIVNEAVKKHTATVIMSHGLGDTGSGWSWPASQYRQQEKFEEVKFIFPTAPTIPVTINAGKMMPAWYDIRVFGDRSTASQDQAGIIRSQQYLYSLIQTEIEHGIPSNRIVQGGFSQGGSISIFSGATAPMKLGGVFCLSGFLLLSEDIEEFMHKNAEVGKTPILLAHGDADQVVKPALAQMTSKRLKDLGMNVELKIYRRMGHSSNQQELDDLEAFLNVMIPPLEEKGGASD